MTVEEILIDLGDAPLRKSAYSKVMHAVLNAYLPGDTPVTDIMNGQEILSKIYQLPDHALQEKILGKELGAVRSSDRYRTALLIFSGLIGFTTVFVALAEVLSASSVTGPMDTNNLTRIAEMLVGVVEIVLNKE